MSRRAGFAWPAVVPPLITHTLTMPRRPRELVKEAAADLANGVKRLDRNQAARLRAERDVCADQCGSQFLSQRDVDGVVECESLGVRDLGGLAQQGLGGGEDVELQMEQVGDGIGEGAFRDLRFVTQDIRHLLEGQVGTGCGERSLQEARPIGQGLQRGRFFDEPLEKD